MHIPPHTHTLPQAHITLRHLNIAKKILVKFGPLQAVPQPKNGPTLYAGLLLNILQTCFAATNSFQPNLGT